MFPVMRRVDHCGRLFRRRWLVSSDLISAGVRKWRRRSTKTLGVIVARFELTLPSQAAKGMYLVHRYFREPLSLADE